MLFRFDSGRGLHDISKQTMDSVHIRSHGHPLNGRFATVPDVIYGELSRIGIAAAASKAEGPAMGVGVRVPRSPPNITEDCQSLVDWSSLLRSEGVQKTPRGFESHIFRQILYNARVAQLEEGGCLKRSSCVGSNPSTGTIPVTLKNV